MIVFAARLVGGFQVPAVKISPPTAIEGAGVGLVLAVEIRF
jgi:hypothetical protein